MTAQKGHADKLYRHQFLQMHRLQNAEQSCPKSGKSHELMINSSTGLVHICCRSIMDTADNQKEGNDSPRYEFWESQLVIGYRIEMGHFLDWLPEKIHLVVQKGITEQEPIRSDNPHQTRQKASSAHGTERNHASPEKRNEIDDLREYQAS